jgi:co-chaperonin GroES (HSP10)
MDECSPVSSGAAGMALMKESGVAAASVVPMPGVRLPDDVIERMTMGAETGVLVAVAAGAFLLNEDGTAWSGYKPRPGDRVYIEKYAGKLIRGRDGRNYRLMDYQSIGATYDEEQD